MTTNIANVDIDSLIKDILKTADEKWEKEQQEESFVFEILKDPELGIPPSKRKEFIEQEIEKLYNSIWPGNTFGGRHKILWSLRYISTQRKVKTPVKSNKPWWQKYSKRLDQKW